VRKWRGNMSETEGKKQKRIKGTELGDNSIRVKKRAHKNYRQRKRGADEGKRFEPKANFRIGRARVGHRCTGTGTRGNSKREGGIVDQKETHIDRRGTAIEKGRDRQQSGSRGKG